jgi:hypothetical protein
MRSLSLTVVAVLVAGGALVSSSPAQACEVCFGAADDPATLGMNGAILFLLGIIGLVQFGFISLFWGFRKRSRSLSEKKKKLRVLQGGLH